MSELSTDIPDATAPRAAPAPPGASARGRAWLFLAFLGVAFALSIPALSSRSYNSDEAYLATQAQMLNRGAHLYVDTVDRKPPVVPYLYAGVFRVTGSDDIRPVRVLMIVTNALTALVLAAEAERRFRDRRAAVIAGLLFLGSVAAFAAKDAQTANFETFMLPTMVASVLLAWRARPLASGVALSVSILTKQNAALTLIPLVWIVWRQRGSRRLSGPTLLFVGTVAPIFLAALVFGVQPFTHWVFTSNDQYVDVRGVVGFATGLFLRESMHFALAHAAVVVLAACAWRRRRDDADLWLWTAAGLLAVASGFRFFGHYYLQLLPPLCLLATRPLLGASKRALAAVAVVMLATAAWFAVAAFIQPQGKTERVAADLASYARAHVAPGRQILVWGHLPEVYWKSDRPTASRFATTGFLTGLSGGRPPSRVGMQYSTPEAWDDFEKDLRDHPPALIFDLAPADVRNASTAPPARFPRFGRFLDLHYRKVARVDSVAVYAPRDAAR
jgi:hypothetical protein